MKKIEQIASELLKHKTLYYAGKTIISDEAYDALEAELKELDAKHPVLGKVGAPVIDPALKVPHATKMLSLDKTYSQEDLISWIGNRDVVSIFKLDGSSCSLIYENGYLVMAKTRGDGEVGENILSKAVNIPSIPKFIPLMGLVEVRGEIFCTEENFNFLSEEMVSLNLDRPSSQRNIVAGLLGRKENLGLARHLSFNAFELITDEKLKLESEKLKKLSTLGFEVPYFEVHAKAQGIEERISEAKKFLTDGNYLIDGLVLIFNELSLHLELGETGHHPKYKLAFKFQGETKNAVISSIDWQVSRNGVLTPVANIEPVELSGAMIGRVTLHNYGQAKNHDLASGDTIEIVRSGEVIPKFLGVVSKSKNSFSHPVNCPSCEQKLSVIDIRLWCLNDKCPTKIKEQILNYIEKANIEDLSDKRLEEMMSKGIVKGIADLYKVSKDDLLSLDKVKDKMAQKLWDNIQATKSQKLIQFIAAVGVEGVSSGSKIEKMINAGFADLSSIMSITVEQLSAIDGFADKSAKTFVDSVALKKELISELLNLGVNVKSEVLEKLGSALAGATICITGELSAPRKEIELLIKQNGGMTSGSVSKKTTYLLTNETESSSSKFVKAKELGVKIITEAELIQMTKAESR